MHNWKEYKLNDLAVVQLSNVDKKTKANEKTVRLCNYTDVYKNAFINNEKAQNFMVATCNDNEFKKFLLKEGQVAITKDSETTDDIGVPTYIATSFNDVLLGYHLSLITPNKNKLDGKFLYYYLNTKQSKLYFTNNAGGSGQRCSLSLVCIKSTPVNIPDLDTQKTISKFLFDLDAKIELNNRINAELEAMAKTIYDYWFVQFDFPNEKGEPYKSSGGKMVYNNQLKSEIPEGWEVEQISKILRSEKNTTKILASNILDSGLLPVIDQSTEFICGFTDDISARIQSDIPRIVFGDHTRILKLINFDFARGADGTQILLSNNSRLSQLLFYHQLLDIDLSNYGYARHFKFLKEHYVLLPIESISLMYESLSKPMYDMIKQNIFENMKLTQLRDWLLPMLMNGQVKVK
ncbi:MAG: restriction endonuclease subunit S [Ignavibacteriaceae bacterium]|nr:restriction endonuclease subunit S [Ignavibacteriaceae bacterium]